MKSTVELNPEKEAPKEVYPVIAKWIPTGEVFGFDAKKKAINLNAASAIFEHQLVGTGSPYNTHQWHVFKPGERVILEN